MQTTTAPADGTEAVTTAGLAPARHEPLLDGVSVAVLSHTPGVRPAGSAPGDQKRIATPLAALAAGADHLVAGRPICAAPDPRAAARAILAEIAPAEAHA